MAATTDLTAFLMNVNQFPFPLAIKATNNNLHNLVTKGQKIQF